MTRKPGQAAALAPHAGGVIVGSALVRSLLEAQGAQEGVAAALALAGELRGAMPANQP